MREWSAACSCVFVLGAVISSCATQVITPDENASGTGGATSVGSGDMVSTGAGGAPTSTSSDAASTGSGSATSSSSSGGDLALGSDVLNPGEVYLAGTLEEGACYRDALVHWSAPNIAALGFDCDWNSRTAQIRPTDGRMLYATEFDDELREFHCDNCPYVGPYPSAPYPSETLANDTLLLKPPNHLTRFLVAPAGNVLYHNNKDSHTWLDENGKVMYSDPDDLLIHLGYGDLALTQHRVMHLSSGISAPIKGLPDGEALSYVARAVSPDRFLAVVDPAEELWQIDSKGLATKIGAFSPLPPSVSAAYAISRVLDAQGVMFEFGEGPMVFQDIILRRQTNGVSDIVYDEANNPLVKIHGSVLITGP